MHSTLLLFVLAGVVLPIAPTSAQTHRTDDSVIHRIWTEGTEHSRVESLAQALVDSIGPRLTGSPGFLAAADWLVRTYESWGVTVREEQYGTWRGWRQGAVHADLVAPRVQTLHAHLLAWSVGTSGSVEGDVLVPPTDLGPTGAERWLAEARGDWVLVSPPELTCRAPQELADHARPETLARIAEAQQRHDRAWSRRFAPLGPDVVARLAASGIAGLLTSRWSGGWGTTQIHNTPTADVPALSLSCEDYGLLARLAEQAQGPRLRVDAAAEELGEVPTFNVVAELQGTALPDEYVVLSAHLDSWHAATGATDNGTGTVMMLEAMRILRAVYPNPKRTILAGHWAGEEQGLHGSGAFAEDHPEVLDGLQALFNQDNGTWRIDSLEAQGFQHAGPQLARWMAMVPAEIADHVALHAPGAQAHAASDHVSFLCRGVPAFRLQSPYPEYRQYLHHTNLDTYDKIVLDDLRENAILAAMLAYAASEDPERVPRDRAALSSDGRTGRPRDWVRCGTPRRSGG